MTMFTALLLAALLGYLCGSIPFGYVAGKLKGIDLRQHGSGNIGATNAVRVLGKPIGLTVFLLDFLKGWGPVWAAATLAPCAASLSPNQVQLLAVIAAISSILGHTYTCWLGGKGGKGVATSIGTLFGLLASHPLGLVIVLGIWIIVFAISRYVSLASILAASSLPAYIITREAIDGKFSSGTWNIPLTAFSLAVAFLVVWRHRSNISRLLAGTESRAFSKKKSQA